MRQGTHIGFFVPKVHDLGLPSGGHPFTSRGRADGPISDTESMPVIVIPRLACACTREFAMDKIGGPWNCRLALMIPSEPASAALFRLSAMLPARLEAPCNAPCARFPGPRVMPSSGP